MLYLTKKSNIKQQTVTRRNMESNELENHKWAYNFHENLLRRINMRQGEFPQKLGSQH